MVSLPDLFVEENDVAVSTSSDTPAVRRNSSSLAEAEICHGNSDGKSGYSAATKRRARVMKTLHDLHRLAWARRQTDCTKLLEASPELAAADLTSRTDAVTVYYSRSRWEHVASAVPPLSYEVRLQRFCAGCRWWLRCCRTLSDHLRANCCTGGEQELSKRLTTVGMSTPPNSPVFSLPDEALAA